jgi:putative peptidoglycan lipid II flippase
MAPTSTDDISTEGRAAVARPTIARSTAVMSASTALSRITGFIRTWAIAYALGVTLLASSYAVANNIPNMIFELVAGGIITSLFIPIFLERWDKDSEKDAWRFASSLFNLVTIVMCVVAVLGTVWAEAFVRTQTFRISPEEAELATYFFRFFAVQVVFYGSGSIISAILNSQRKFFWPAIGPVFNNLVVIVTLLGFYVPFRESDPDLAITGLAVGTTLGVLTMFAVQVPSLLKLKPQYSWRIDLSHPGLRRIARLAIPTVVYVVTNMVAISFRNAYAFEVSPEGPATLQYAWMFYQLPYGIFAVALATAVFTELSDSAGQDDWAAFKHTFGRGLRATAVLIIPMAAMLVALSEPVITLYRAGEFRAEDVPVVAEVLVWWAAGLFFFATYMYMLRTFYSVQDTKTPAGVNLVLTVLQISLYAVLTVGIGTWAGLGLKGIPIADGIFFAISLTALALLLRRKIGGYDIRGVVWVVVRVTAASAVGAVVAYLLVLNTAALAESTLGFLVQLALGGIVGLGVAYGLAALFRVREVSDGFAMVRRVFSRAVGGSGGTS